MELLPPECGFDSCRSGQCKGSRMPMYETTVRTPQGDVKDRVWAKDLSEAKQLFEQRHGPRNVPFIPKIIPH